MKNYIEKLYSNALFLKGIITLYVFVIMVLSFLVLYFGYHILALELTDAGGWVTGAFFINIYIIILFLGGITLLVITIVLLVLGILRLKKLYKAHNNINN